eukprot:Pgem_evm4s340
MKGKYSDPFDVWDSAICDFDKAYRAHLAKVAKNVEEGKHDDPSNKCKFKFRSKKDLKRSFEIRHRDFNANNSQYSFLFKEGKFEYDSKHKLFNDDGIEEKIRRGVFPLSYNEAKNRFIPVNHDVRPEDVVAMDLGVSSFMTTYDTKGLCSEWGVDDMKRID